MKLNGHFCEKCGAPCRGRWQIRFCSRSCRTSVLNLGVVRNGNPTKLTACLICGKEHRNKFYCSQICSHIAQKKPITEERIKRRKLITLLAVRKYQAARLSQTPSDADSTKIREIYANCPPGHEVDHKIPISKGGPHHQDNLQYLPMVENRRKSNKLDYGPQA